MFVDSRDEAYKKKIQNVKHINDILDAVEKIQKLKGNDYISCNYKQKVDDILNHCFDTLYSKVMEVR